MTTCSGQPVRREPGPPPQRHDRARGLPRRQRRSAHQPLPRGRRGSAPANIAEAVLGQLGDLVDVPALAASSRSKLTADAPGGPDLRERGRLATAVHDRVRGRRRQHGPQPLAGDRRVDRATTVPSPLAVGTRPASAAGSDGSSTCTISVAPGTRLRTSAACAARPSASDSVRSATAPGSASAGLAEWLSSSAAASVHGPQTWILSGPA